MRKSFKYKAMLSVSAERRAFQQLTLLRELYNAALEERREAWDRRRKSLSFYSQCRELTDVRRALPEHADMDRQVQEMCLYRLQHAFDAFYRRVKNGEKPGYPRFKSARRFRSMTYRQSGWKLNGRHLTLRGVGRIKLFLSRPVEGDIKTVTLKRDRVGDWFVIFACDNVPAKPLAPTGRAIGIDLGIDSFASTSEGENIVNPRHLRAAERDLKRAHRRVNRRKRGGSNRRKAGHLLGKKYRKVARARRDFHFKLARRLVEEYDYIAVERLNVSGMIRGWHAKSVSDAAWSQFLSILRFKAEEAGRTVVEVDACGTSQACSRCGCVPDTPKTLDQRTHRCAECGLVLDRDVNAARNILARAKAEAPPAGSRPASKAAA